VAAPAANQLSGPGRRRPLPFTQSSGGRSFVGRLQEHGIALGQLTLTDARWNALFSERELGRGVADDVGSLGTRWQSRSAARDRVASPKRCEPARFRPFLFRDAVDAGPDDETSPDGGVTQASGIAFDIALGSRHGPSRRLNTRTNSPSE
jgi:hypothetical protein